MESLNEVRLEAYRLSERRLEDQANTALHADQRAMSVAGLALAGAAILCGLSPDAAVPLGLLIGSVFLVIAAGFAWYSARPLDFFMPGASYQSFDKDIAAERPAMEVIEEMGRHNDVAADKNEIILNSNARTLGTAFAASVIGVLIAVIPQLYNSAIFAG